jgi:hypothetical protein
MQIGYFAGNAFVTLVGYELKTSKITIFLLLILVLLLVSFFMYPFLIASFAKEFGKSYSGH